MLQQTNPQLERLFLLREIAEKLKGRITERDFKSYFTDCGTPSCLIGHYLHERAIQDDVNLLDYRISITFPEQFLTRDLGVSRETSEKLCSAACTIFYGPKPSDFRMGTADESLQNRIEIIDELIEERTYVSRS